MKKFRQVAAIMILALGLTLPAGAVSEGRISAASMPRETLDLKSSVTAKAADSARTNLKKLGNAIIKKGEKDSQGNFYISKEKGKYRFYIIYEKKNKKINYVATMSSKGIDTYIDMYQSLSSPGKVSIEGSRYFQSVLLGRARVRLEAAKANASGKKKLGFKIETLADNDDPDGSLKKAILDASEAMMDVSLPFWNAMVKELTGRLMRKLGFSSL